MVETESQATIHHRDRVRVATVRAKLDGISFEAARQKALELLDRLELPPGYRAEIVGIHQVIDESIGELGWVLFIALLLVYAVMAAQFESLGQPLIIMVTVPLAGSGAFLLLWASGHALGVPSLIGLILLSGIAVNTAIVMIDRVNQLRQEGLDPVEAVHRGAAERLRPILMTSITSIFGLIPLALSAGEGSELQAPMAVAVIGGLVSSTFLSLFVIPGLLVLGVHWSRKRTRFRPMTVATVVLLSLALTMPAVADAQAAPTSPLGLEALAGRGLVGRDDPSPGRRQRQPHPARSHYNLQVSGGLAPASPRVISLATGQYLPILGGGAHFGALRLVA